MRERNFCYAILLCFCIAYLSEPIAGCAGSDGGLGGTTLRPTTLGTTTANLNQVNCAKLDCNFEASNTCQFTPGPGQKQFQSRGADIGPRNTGIRNLPPGSTRYAGADLKPRETATMQSAPINVQNAQKLRFKYYKATDGMILKACPVPQNQACFQTDPKVSPDDLKWKEKTMDIPPGTQQIVFTGDNSQGANYGAVGVDDVELLDANGQRIQCPQGPGPQAAPGE